MLVVRKRYKLYKKGRRLKWRIFQRAKAVWQDGPPGLALPR